MMWNFSKKHDPFTKKKNKQKQKQEKHNYKSNMKKGSGTLGDKQTHLSYFVEFLTLPNENNINIKIKFNCTPCETDLERSPKYIYSVCY
jgi:hypothetical protein